MAKKITFCPTCHEFDWLCSCPPNPTFCKGIWLWVKWKAKGGRS